MNRRQFLAAATAGSFAGCASSGGESTPTPGPATAHPTNLARQGTPGDVCERGLVDVGIDAIVEPAFGPDWSAVDVPEEYGPELGGDDAVVGVEAGGRARAYPVEVLWVHEIVNDAFGRPLMVTYCSLCRSGMVAERTVAGEATTFGVSGQLWKPPRLYTRAAEAENRTFAVERSDADPGPVRNTGNLVMFDGATGSYWSQLLARAICGPRTGDTLPPVPSETATWSDWRATHPDTQVLLPPPHSTTMDTPRSLP